MDIETRALDLAKIIKAEIGKVGGVQHMNMWVKPIEEALQAVRDEAIEEVETALPKETTIEEVIEEDTFEDEWKAGYDCGVTDCHEAIRSLKERK